jgi:dihydroflavonol-4-reductase
MTSLVTGAGGFVGSALVGRLLADGHRVRGLVRTPGTPELWRPFATHPRLELFKGDVTEAASLREATAGVDTVFHLAGIRRSPRRETFFQVNTEGTRHICEAMVASGTRRLVLCGSLAATGPSSAERPRQEEDPFSPQEPYGESKARAEELAFSYAPRLEVSSVRPARIFGPGDRENLPFFKLVRKGVQLQLGGGPRPLSLVDVDDVVELLVRAAQRPEAVGEAFFAAAEGTTTFEKIQDQIADELHTRARRVYLPQLALRTAAIAADLFSTVSRRHLPLNRKLARQLLAPAWTCATDKALRRLGFQARITAEESVRRSARWYQEHQWI